MVERNKSFIDYPELDKIVFDHLIKLSESIKSNNRFTEDGKVIACLVRNGKILESASSASGGIIVHAEQNLLGYLQQKKITINKSDILYSTLEPCSRRFDIDGGAPDCTTLIIRAGIKNVVYAANDPVQSILTHTIFRTAGVNLRQTEKLEIQQKSRDLFNRLSRDYKI